MPGTGQQDPAGLQRGFGGEGKRRDEVAGMKLSNIFILGKAVLDSTQEESTQEEIFGIQLRNASAKG